MVPMKSSKIKMGLYCGFIVGILAKVNQKDLGTKILVYNLI